MGSSQAPLFSTGSLFGFHPNPPSQYGYMTAEPERAHTFCGNKEGWGPLSPDRYDFTPCFMDVWVAAVALFGVLGGTAAVWWLVVKKEKCDIEKNWHFWAKQTLIIAIAVSVSAQTAFQISHYPDIWAGDFRVWSSVMTLVSLGFIFTTQWLEHDRLRNPNGVVLFYWLFLIIAYSVKLRSLISQQVYIQNLPYFIAYSVGFGLTWVEFGLEWLVPKKNSVRQELENEDECPIEYATVFSILTFSWMTPLMRDGYKTFLTEDDLWNLAKRDTTKSTGEAFQKAWDRELKNEKGPSLWTAMFRAFSGPFFRGGIFKAVSDTLSFVQPQLLKLLINFVESYKTDAPQPIIRGAAIALGMFAVSAGQSIALNQYFQRAFETGMRTKAALTAAIYQKSLKLSNEGRSSKSTGDIVNYMAVDTQRLQDLTQYGQHLWSAPYQIMLCMLSLYQLLGFSMLAGVAAMLLMVPVNGLIAKFMKRLQQQQMKNKDSRTRLITEIVNNMKSIKLYGWGSAFMQKLNYIRNDQELKMLKKIGGAQAIVNFTWSTTPFLVSCSTFAVFVLTNDIPLTTDLVFPALTLFNLLTFPLVLFPMVITSVIDAIVAVGRLTTFLTAEELQADAVIRLSSLDEMSEVAMAIHDGTFSWDRHTGRNVLEDINFSAPRAELTCIVGRVGSGKSSFLQALLGDLWKVKGQVKIHGSVAYVAQQAWVMNASVKENILFGHDYDPVFYDKAVKACALIEDFAQLPDGDNTEVGDRGTSLSGGQKVRLTLARAVYARADIYLFDDSLSAVDQHVGRHLIENVLGPNGLLRGKTRILATNSIPVLLEADSICLLRDGKIIEQGSYNQLMIMDGEIAKLINSATNIDQSGASSLGDSTATIVTEKLGDPRQREVVEETQQALTGLQPTKHADSGIKERGTNVDMMPATFASLKGPRGKPRDEEESFAQTKQTKETSDQGKVKWSVYAEYAKTSNVYAIATYVLILIAGQAMQIEGNIWLKNWAEVNDKEGHNPHVWKYISIYFGLGIGSSALVVVQTLILWVFCSIKASKELHERMVLSIFRSPMSFFETTPAGRILNRFSSDMYRVDDLLAMAFNILFINSTRAFFTLAIVSASTPAFISLIVPLAGLYYWVQSYYLRTSRELKRLESVSRSPIYAHFQETLSGINTIRAYGHQMRFAAENEWKVDANLRAYFPFINANRWLAVRLEFLGSIIILGAAGFAIISVSSGSGLSAGLVGLAMSYALQITQSLNWMVRQTVDVETNIVSVERVLEYAQLPSEAPEIVHENILPISWPAAGAVKFNNYSTRYREGLDLVLKDVNLDIKPHEKIGVVGRTGAGKSSLTLALFRILEPAEGHISIDSVNTSAIGLSDIRGRLAIIPQDAVLFEGTIRDNLDPGHMHDDMELWNVLELARLMPYIASMDGGLEARINEGGSNLSQGQRQLVSLARALLSPSSILVLDEATAAVDVETDALIQTMLRSPLFSKRTIITIAHRINTILDSDRIVVLDQGKVVEFDTPKRLLEGSSDGLFYKLAKEAGLVDVGR